MPKAKPAADAASEGEVVSGGDTAKVSKKDATKATVVTDQGAHLRTYSVEDHGGDFHDNAKEFSAHTPGSSIVLS